MVSLDRRFSKELKEVVSRSREIAIDLGYEYISSIHFLLADYESERASSIFKFAFRDRSHYLEFKNDYRVKPADLFSSNDGILPVTVEAEITIRLTEKERILHNHEQCYPFHLFIASLKNKESFISDCFRNDEHALDKLIKYYQDLGEFDRAKEKDHKYRKGIIGYLLKVFSQRKVNI